MRYSRIMMFGLMLSGIMASCGSSGPKNESQKQMKEVYDQYDKLTSDFIISDGAKASAKAKDMKKTIEKIDTKTSSPSDIKAWNDLSQSANPELDSIIANKDIKIQRMHFALLSKAMYTGLKTIEIPGQTVYYQHCPMFNQDHGGSYWLSKQEDINNPYFGNDMLNCGETVETVKGK